MFFNAFVKTYNSSCGYPVKHCSNNMQYDFTGKFIIADEYCTLINTSNALLPAYNYIMVHYKPFIKRLHGD